MQFLRYTAQEIKDRPGYFSVCNPMGDHVWSVWQEDFGVVWLMYENSLRKWGVDRANDLMFGYLLGMTHFSLHHDKYPKCELEQMADGVTTVCRVTHPEPLPPPPAAHVTPLDPVAHTTDRSDPALREIKPGGQQAKYIVLSDEERAKGFIRPVRTTYRHLACGSTTTVGRAIAETYARNPAFYGATFCCTCSKHFPLKLTDGAPAFVWIDDETAVGS